MTNSASQDMFIFHVLNINPEVPNGVSSPVMANPPSCSYGCPAQCYHFNLNASLSDGDSISYSLGPCLSLAGVCAGYDIPSNVTINSTTGELSWCNPTDGLWSFSIRMTTYDSLTISGHRTQIAIDTEEVELQMEAQSNCTLGTDKITNTVAGYTVYPNPSKGVFTIQSAVVSGQSLVELYNVLGEKVGFNTFTIRNSQFTIDLSSNPNGVYLYRVISENGNLLGEGKLVVQK